MTELGIHALYLDRGLMRIFYAFLIMFCSVFLFLLPLTEAAYDFKTDIRTDTFATETAAGITSVNETLFKPLYDSDIATVDILSTLATDVPTTTSYNATSRQLWISGLTASSNRSLEVSYDIDSLTGFPAIATLLDKVPFIWMLIIIAFAPAALFAIFTGRT